MSNADEMFEELGYENVTVNYKSQNNCIIYENKDGQAIYFDLEVKSFGTYEKEQLYKCGMFSLVSVQELQAINEKVKELGWLDE